MLRPATVARQQHDLAVVASKVLRHRVRRVEPIVLMITDAD
jgi:hypothetical protein